MSVIILGGCGEIGRYIAADLVKSGIDVSIADIREYEGELIAKRLGKRASFVTAGIESSDTWVSKRPNTNSNCQSHLALRPIPSCSPGQA